MAYINLVVTVLICLLLVIFMGHPSLSIARFFGLIDIPGSALHKTHKLPMPLAGGVLITITLLISMMFLYDKLRKDVLIMLISSFVIFLFGVWDDKKGLSATTKLLGQFIAGGILIFNGVQVHFVDTLYRAGYLTWLIAQAANILLTWFWLIGITNAVNMIDSMDGIVAGIAVIASVCYLYATSVSNQQILSIWSAVLLGVSCGLYFWNKMARKMFLGDSGSQVIGFLLATLGILYNPKNMNPESSWFLPIMLLGVPIFDTTLVVLSRLKKKQRISVGRRDHTYHRLIALGFSPNAAVFITHLASMVISGLGFFTFFLNPIFAIGVFFTSVVFGLVTLFWFEGKPTLDNELSEIKNITA